MYPIGLLAALFLFFGSLSIQNYRNAAMDAHLSEIAFVSGQFRAYGHFVADFARANPSFTGNVSDTAAQIPSWLNRPTGIKAYAKAGQAFVYYVPTTLAEANEIARTCAGSLLCGVTRAGALYVPGEASADAVAVPSVVPQTGALVLVIQ